MHSEMNFASHMLNVYEKMFFCRQFELKVVEAHKSGQINIPIYLSIGQESIPATISTFFAEGIPLFAQHRAHSYFLSFGGDPNHLIGELKSSTEIWSKGSGGSASISSKSIQMFGHSGLMGDQVPIAVGYCLSKNSPVLTVVGDASLEEDYVISSFMYAISKNLPFLFVCEDNNLSILTPKSDRRTWEFSPVVKAMGGLAFDIDDNPESIWEVLSQWKQNCPIFINIRTNRHYWHAGSGEDAKPDEDRLQLFRNYLEKTYDLSEIKDIESRALMKMRSLWQ
jgi:pyruvate dehydrogenase E1 component alpha subunit